MPTYVLKRMRRGLVMMLVAVLTLSIAATGAQPATAQGTPTDGIICTTSPGANFTMTTTQGYITQPDDNTIYMWGYAVSGQPFQHPSPVLCVNEGETVTVILNNTLSVPVSITFPGQENVLANGAPAQPQFDANSALTSLTNVAQPGGSVTYSFVASRPGTFIYQSGTNPDVQIRMGLFGALIVRPAGYAGNAPKAYDRDDSAYTAGEEYMVLLSEIDPYLNQAVERNELASYDMNSYQPRYWLINGRGFPDAIAPNFASWLPTQPYGALARIHPLNTDPGAGPAYHPLPGMVRYLNVGTGEFPFHPHGNNGYVIGRDGYPLQDASGNDLSYEKFVINLGPGQTWDVLFQWHDAENYNADPTKGTTIESKVQIPNLQNLVYGMFYSGSPYLGVSGPIPVGETGMTQCGEFYIISHNHALYQLDSWGVPMTGPVTFVRVDPPLPNSCPQ